MNNIEVRVQDSVEQIRAEGEKMRGTDKACRIAAQTMANDNL